MQFYLERDGRLLVLVMHELACAGLSTLADDIL